MRRLRYLPLPSLLVALLLPLSAFAAPWVESPAFYTDNQTLSSSKVDAADLNGDGFFDIVFANGSGYNKGTPDSIQPQTALFNQAGENVVDVSNNIFGATQYNGRAVKLRDVDNDGAIDIVLGTTWQSQSQLFMGDGAGNFDNTTPMSLPQGPLSVGDIELGDVDNDGDLDMLLADWGADEEADLGMGGVTKLWLQMGAPPQFNDIGTGLFEAAPANMPNVNVRWSWDLEFVDIDNDYDLDIVVSCFACQNASGFLFINDGSGNFTNATPGNYPQSTNALDVEPIDIDGDGFLDLLSTRDGPNGRNRILINNKDGGFTNATDMYWPPLQNPSSRDHSAAFYDYNSDGNVDIVLGALKAGVNPLPDRLMIQENNKTYTQNNMAFEELAPSDGTYSIVLADLNLDRRLDVVMAQNENGTQKKVFLASEEIPVDTAAPIFVNYEKLEPLKYPGEETIRVRCHDNKSPLMLHDFTQDAGFPYIESWTEEPIDPDTMPGTLSAPGQWYGEYLWRIHFVTPDAAQLWYRICAIDAAGNKACTDLENSFIEGGTLTDTDTDTDTDNTESAASATDSTASESNTDSNTGSTITMTEPTESDSKDADVDADTNTDSNASIPTESTMSASNTMNSESATASESDTAIDSASELDDDGCSCDANNSPTRGVLSSLALLGLIALRRRRS